MIIYGLSDVCPDQRILRTFDQEVALAHLYVHRLTADGLEIFGQFPSQSSPDGTVQLHNSLPSAQKCAKKQHDHYDIFPNHISLLISPFATLSRYDSMHTHSHFTRVVSFFCPNRERWSRKQPKMSIFRQSRVHFEAKMDTMVHILQRHAFGNEEGGVTTVFEDVADGCRGYVCELLCCRDDNGLHIRSQTAVRIGDGALRLEIYHVADSPDDVTDAKFTALVDGQVVVLDDADALQPDSRLSDDLDPLLVREEASLVYIDSHSHDHFVEHGQGSFQDIEMSCSERVKGPWKHRYSFHNQQLTLNHMRQMEQAFQFIILYINNLELPVNRSQSARGKQGVRLRKMTAAEERTACQR